MILDLYDREIILTRDIDIWCHEHNLKIVYSTAPIVVPRGKLRYLDYIDTITGEEQDIVAFRLRFGI